MNNVNEQQLDLRSDNSRLPKTHHTATLCKTLQHTATRTHRIYSRNHELAGMSDVNGQQLDLRRENSWLLKMHQVSTPELLEVFISLERLEFLI